MGVFADDDRRPRSRGEGRQHLPEEPVARVAVEGGCVDQEAKRRGKVAHGTERTRRGERVAGGPQHRRSAATRRQNSSTRVGLADSGLAANEHQAPVPGGGLAQMLLELLQVRFPLE